MLHRKNASFDHYPLWLKNPPKLKSCFFFSAHKSGTRLRLSHLYLRRQLCAIPHFNVIEAPGRLCLAQSPLLVLIPFPEPPSHSESGSALRSTYLPAYYPSATNQSTNRPALFAPPVTTRVTAPRHGTDRHSPLSYHIQSALCMLSREGARHGVPSTNDICP